MVWKLLARVKGETKPFPLLSLSGERLWGETRLNLPEQFICQLFLNPLLSKGDRAGGEGGVRGRKLALAGHDPLPDRGGARGVAYPLREGVVVQSTDVASNYHLKRRY